MRLPADLLVAAQTGDPDAMRHLLAAAQPDVRRYARRQCHRGSVIEDVVQETLMVIWRRVGSVRDPAAFAGWLITVVTRLCMIPALMLTRGVEELDDIMISRSLARLPADDLRIDLERAFESLPPAHREIVLLRDFEELSLAEIARRLDLTVEATKSRLHRARASLREYLLGHENKR